jgi:hypothetical protein
MFPNDRLATFAVEGDKPVQRLHHVAVANVPGLGVPANHGAVILLGISSDERILFGVEELLAAVMLIRGRLPSQFTQHLHNVFLARVGNPHGGAGVSLFVAAERLKALKGAPRRFRRIVIGCSV